MSYLPKSLLGSATCNPSTCEYNKLSELPAEVWANLFVGLSNLQSLDLGYNKLSELPAEVFAGLSNLQSLNLRYNKLSELPAEVFVGLSNLQSLNLEYNKLSELPAEFVCWAQQLAIPQPGMEQAQ